MYETVGPIQTCLMSQSTQGTEEGVSLTRSYGTISVPRILGAEEWEWASLIPAVSAESLMHR